MNSGKMPGRSGAAKTYRRMLLAQAAYFILTGSWPLIDLQTFMLVTGPKHDTWLVHMVGLLALCNGLTMLYCLYRPAFEKTGFLLGFTSGLSFAAVDVYYALPGTISRVYFIDAGIETLFVISFLLFFRNAKAPCTKL